MPQKIRAPEGIRPPGPSNALKRWRNRAITPSYNRSNALLNNTNTENYTNIYGFPLSSGPLKLSNLTPPAPNTKNGAIANAPIEGLLPPNARPAVNMGNVPKVNQRNTRKRFNARNSSGKAPRTGSPRPGSVASPGAAPERILPKNRTTRKL